MGRKEIEDSLTLPATRLVGEEIEDLEQVLQTGNINNDLTYEVVDGSTVYTYNSASEMRSDPTVPDFVRDFSISLECDSGALEINSTTGNANSPTELLINGAPEWVRSKRAGVQDFFSAKQDTVRTFVEGTFRLELAVAAVLATVAYLLQWLGIAARYGINSQEDINSIILWAVIVTLFSRGIFSRFYPYTLLVLNPNKELYPFVKRLIYFVTLVAAIIAINSWVAS